LEAEWSDMRSCGFRKDDTVEEEDTLEREDLFI
jgi:hypothetical protein